VTNEHKPNRKERRAMGFRGPAYVQMQGDTRPRYVRRHIGVVGEFIGNEESMPRRVRRMAQRIYMHAERVGLRGRA
jgi:hypothetical protein